MFVTVTVKEYQRGLEYRRGRFVGQLPAGRYRLWVWSGREVTVVDVRENAVQVPGQELLTADRAVVRLNVLVRYRIVDPAKAVHEVASYADALYQTVQLAVREAVAQREVESLLNDRAAITAELTAAVAEKVTASGLEVLVVALKDVALNATLQMAYQMKLRLEQEGQAKLVEARHAVAAARAQANAARVLAETPGMALQKQLEVLATAAQHGMGNHFIMVPEGLAALVRRVGGD